MIWNKEISEHKEGDLKHWYQELPFLGDGVDLILARKVWSFIFWPLFFLSVYGIYNSIINWSTEWWLIIPSIIFMIWSYTQLDFIWTKG